MNSPLNLICPKCGSNVSIGDALKHQIEDDLKKQLHADNSKQIDSEKKKLHDQMLAWQEDEKKKFEQLTEQLTGQIKSEQELAAKALQQELEEKTQKLVVAEKLELQLRQDKNSLEEEKRRFELEKQRQIDAERDKIRRETADTMLEQYQLKDKEKDKQLDDMRRKIEELQLKAQLNSQQLQGEVLELELEEILRNEFPFDEIVPVPKGINGADILQRVRNSQGQGCGVIVWESKRTKNWTEGWVQKLKDDQRLSKADVAILVSNVLPEGLKNFGPKDGIYVSNFECVLSLAKFVRLSLIQLCSAKMSVVGKNEKMEMIYNYLSGQEFRGRVEAIVEAFTAMKKDLDDEKKAFVKIWAKREKEIERVLNNTIGMHGDLQGLMGQSLPQIASIEITTIEIVETN